MPGTLEALLATANIPLREAQMLAAEVVGQTRAWVIAHAETTLSPAQHAQLSSFLVRRAEGEPYAYITGTREFYGRPFAVSRAVLIPRPETEVLIEQALARLSNVNHPKTSMDIGLSPLEPPLGRTIERGESRESLSIAPPAEAPAVLDLGTGCGVIAITLACERPDIALTGVDISDEALEIARGNALAHKARVRFVQSHWGAALTNERFEMIVSNPPYVARGDQHLSQGDLRFEPRIALTDQSIDGLDSIRTITTYAATHLSPRGWLLIEHGYDQAARCRDIFKTAGLAHIESIADLAGIERVTAGQLV